jgi:hypothetical protein
LDFDAASAEVAARLPTVEGADDRLPIGSVADSVGVDVTQPARRLQYVLREPEPVLLGVPVLPPVHFLRPARPIRLEHVAGNERVVNASAMDAREVEAIKLLD